MDIYDYLDSRELLEALIAQKKRDIASFSLRGLSQKAGLKSSGYISMILQGKRRLTVSAMEKMLPQFHLTKNEEAYIIELIRFTNAKNGEVKERSFEMLKALRNSVGRKATKREADFYAQWYFALLKELVNIANITDQNIAEVIKRVDPALTLSEVKEGLEVLVSLDLLYKDSKGRYKSRDKIIRAATDFDRYQLHTLMKKNLSLAVRALDSQMPQRRELSTLTLSINSDTYEKIREKLSVLRSEILALAGSTEVPTDVYQLNMQIFPLTSEVTQ